MRTHEIEPGLLPIFRVLVGLQFLIKGVAVIELTSDRVAHHYPVPVIVATSAMSVVLLAYLCWPGLPDRLGRAFLPIALVWDCAIPFVGQYVLLSNVELRPYVLSTGELIEGLSVLLIFPLLVISCQYGMHSVIVFCLLTGMTEIMLSCAVVGYDDLVGSHWLRWPFMRTIVFLALGLVISYLMTRQREQRRSLRQANARLSHYAATLEQLAVSRERNRLARELHDTLAHTLSGLAVQLEAIRSLWDIDRDAAFTMLQQSLTTARTGLTETRRAVQSLRATPLEDMGLRLALSNLVESFAARTGLEVRYSSPEDLTDLPPDVEQSLYRVAQEALENVCRHSDAKSVSVRLARADRRLELTVADDGQGFDPATIDRGYGIDGMRERAELMHASLTVTSCPGQGTIISLLLEDDHDSRACL